MTFLTSNPNVYLMSEPKINKDEFFNWYTKNIDEDLNVDDSPINKIMSRLNDTKDYSEKDGTYLVEFAGRHCYRSWYKGRETPEYIENIIEQDHNSVLRHTHLSFAIQGISRNLSLEHNRHWSGVDLSQESQRYVPMENTNFVVPPLYLIDPKTYETKSARHIFERGCLNSLDEYNRLIKLYENSTLPKKVYREAAREVLNSAVETRMEWTVNIQTLRHYFEKRGSEHAALEIRRLAVTLFEKVHEMGYGIFFYDFKIGPVINSVRTIEKLRSVKDETKFNSFFDDYIHIKLNKDNIPHFVNNSEDEYYIYLLGGNQQVNLGDYIVYNNSEIHWFTPDEYKKKISSLIG